MSQAAIFGPFLALMVLTLAVWIALYVTRIRYLVNARINPQNVASRKEADAVIPDDVNKAANNFKNLCELPVLFYALCLYLYVTTGVDLAYVIAAWTFVAFRALHSLVQCTSNHVMTRFRLYMIASLALWFMVVRAVIQVIV